jgi:hypothetical protein
VQPGRCEPAVQNADRTVKTVTGSPETSRHTARRHIKHCRGYLKFRRDSVRVFVSSCGDGGKVKLQLLVCRD